MPGKFITFEGPEGSGKSTQIQLLAERLRAQGKDVFCTREPGGTATGEAIRKILQHDSAGEELDEHAELLLFTASRAQLMSQVILPKLETGCWILCDRFIDSTMAYQGYARGMDLNLLNSINTFATYERMPDLTLLLDVDVIRGFERLEERYAEGAETHDRFEREARDFHLKVREGYHELAKNDPDRIKIIDATETIEKVEGSVWSLVQEALLS